MAYTARGIIDNARSLAQLQNTKFISFSDEVNLINEAYRDLYSRYTESDGDYWCTEIVISPTGAQIDPNNNQGYLIPLPADFLKIRTLSYNYGSIWRPVQKFSMSQRDNITSQPMYRLKNGNLWVIGAGSFNQLKLNYYPIPKAITAPDNDITLAVQEQVYDYQSIISHYYDAGTQTFSYTTGLIIKIENLKTNTTASVYTSANAVDSIVYKAGYVYWRDTVAKIIYRAKTDFVATLVPVSIKTTVENFSIQGNYIYYSTLSDTRRCNLDGSGDIQLQVYVSKSYTIFGANSLYVNASTFIYLNGVATLITGVDVMTDGTYVIIQDLTGGLARYSIVTGVLTFVSTIASGILTVGNAISNAYVSIVYPDAVRAESVTVDYVFDYPTNEVNEIMAYMSAIAYVRKQADQSMMTLLTARLTELWDLFWSVNKRDEYQSTRINNDYQQVGMGGY